MGPLSGQEKFPKSSAQLNGIPGVGQGGVGAPEVERLPQVALGGDWQGSPQATMGTLSTVGISGEQPALGNRAGEARKYIQLLKPPGPQFSPPALLQEGWGWPQRRLEWWDGPSSRRVSPRCFHQVAAFH